MRYILLLCLTASALAQTIPVDNNGSVIVSKDASGYIIGPTVCQPTDPRRVLVVPGDHAVMQPYYDNRGCPRWQVVSGKIQFVQPADRQPPREAVRKAWADLARWRAIGADALITGLTPDSDLQAYYNSELAKYQAAYDDLTRAGKASDDPVAPSKTTVTPQ